MWTFNTHPEHLTCRAKSCPRVWNNWLMSGFIRKRCCLSNTGLHDVFLFWRILQLHSGIGSSHHSNKHLCEWRHATRPPCLACIWVSTPRWLSNVCPRCWLPTHPSHPRFFPQATSSLFFWRINLVLGCADIRPCGWWAKYKVIKIMDRLGVQRRSYTFERFGRTPQRQAAAQLQLCTLWRAVATICGQVISILKCHILLLLYQPWGAAHEACSAGLG